MATSSTVVPTDETRRPFEAATRVVLTLADQAVVSGASFLSGVIVCKATSKEQFGLYGLGFTVAMIVAELQSALISTPQTVFGPRYHGLRNAQFQGSMLLKLLLLAAINTLMLMGGSLLATALGKPDLGHVLAAIAVGVTALHLGMFVRVTCFAHLNPLGALLVDCFTCIVQLLALMLLWHYGKLNAWTAWATITLAALVPALIFLLYWNKNMHFSRDGAREDFHLTWLQTRFVLASSLLWIGGMHLYAWLIEAFADRDGVAEWTACIAIAAIGNPLMYGVMNVLGPQIAHRHRALPLQEFRRYMWKASAAFFAMMSLFAITVTLLADFLMLHVYRPEYVGHTAVVAMLAFGIAARVPGFVASRGLFAFDRADLELLNNIAPLAVMLLMGIALTDRYRVAGAAFSLLVAQVIGSVTRIIFFERCVRAEAAQSASDDASASTIATTPAGVQS